MFETSWKKGRGAWVQTEKETRRGMAWVYEMPSRIEVQAAKKGLVSKEKIKKVVEGGWYKWMEIEQERQNPDLGEAGIMGRMTHLSYTVSYGKYYIVRQGTRIIDTEALPLRNLSSEV
jgi:hypothetical protein